MLTQLSHDLAAAVAAIRPSLRTHRGRRGHSTLFAIDAHHAIGSAHGLRRPGRFEHDGHTVDAELIGRHRGLDLALVRVDAELSPVVWADTPEVGHLVLPVGAGPRATLGLVTAVAGPWHSPQGTEIDTWIEVDGSLPPGFSGGPLLAADGTVIGMNTRRLVRGGTTIPASTLREAIATLQARGTVEPGFLGIGATGATLTEAQAKAAGQDTAMLVVAVEPGSPAEGVLTVGDVVLSVAGEAVHGVPSLRRILDHHGPDTDLLVTLLDGEEVQERTATLGARPRCC
jgi:serine protease Do